jgi:hypothetical protein
MSNASPLARVKGEFGGKDKLVDKIVGLLGSTSDEPKDEMRKRLLGAANSKLIKLHDVASSLKQYGGQDKLVEAAATGLGRAKDKDYVQKLSTYSAGRLLDIVRVTSKAAKAPAGEKAPAKAKASAKKSGGEAKASKAPAKTAKATEKNA